MRLEKDVDYCLAEKNLDSCNNAMRKIEMEIYEIGSYIGEVEKTKLKPGETVDELMARVDKFNHGSIEKLRAKHLVLKNSLIELKTARYTAERAFEIKLGKSKQGAYDKIAKVFAESYINIQQALLDEIKLSNELEAQGGSLAGVKKHFWLDNDRNYPNGGDQYQLDFYRGLLGSGLVKKEEISPELKNEFPPLFPQRPELTV